MPSARPENSERDGGFQGLATQGRTFKAAEELDGLRDYLHRIDTL